MLRFRCPVPCESVARTIRFFAPALLCAALAVALLPAAHAQVQFLGQTLSTTNYGLGPSSGGNNYEGGPQQVAVNASGTIATGATTFDRIIRIDPGGSPAVVLQGHGTLNGVAIDNAGNIYSNNQSTLFKVAPDGTVTTTALGIQPAIDSYCHSLANEGYEDFYRCEGTTAASALAIDPQGNVYMAFGEPFWWVLEAPAGGGPAFLINTYPLVVNTPSGLATDSAGNVYIGDVYNDRIIKVTPGGQDNSGIDPAGLALGSPWMTIDGITLYQGLSSLGVDSQGNIYAGSTLYDGGQQFLERIDPSGQSYLTLPVGGGGVAGIGVDSQDNIYFANNVGFIVKYATRAPSFGSAAVGTSAATVSLPFVVRAGTTVNSLSFMTGSAQNLDFNDAGSDNCTFPQTFTSDTTCNIHVSFTPSAPGVRAGALVFADAGGNVLLSTALEGTGTGPLPVFNSSAETLLTPSSLQYPQFGTTVSDQSGNLYIAFTSQNEILQVPQGGPSAVLPLGSAAADPQQPAISATLSGPTAVAMDNGGNLYIADTGNNRVVVRQPVQGSTTGQYFLYALPLGGLTLNAPNGLATDAAGNVYVMDNGNNRVIEVTPSGHASVLPNVNLGTQPVYGFSADSTGNLYLSGNGEVVKYVAGSWAGSSVYDGNPQAVAIDAAGDLYIADYDTPQGLVEIPVGGTAQTLAIGHAGTLQEPSNVSIDSAGNLYITNAYGVYEIARSTTALNFATSVLNQISPDSPQTVQLINAGNAPVNLSSVTYPSDFPENTSDSALCGAGTVLAPGIACDVSVNFSPASTGELSESVTIVDNAINPIQAVSLSGTGSAGGQSQTVGILNRSMVAANICCGTYPTGPTFYVNDSAGLPVTLTVLTGPMTFNGALTTTVSTSAGQNRLVSSTASAAGSGVIQVSQAGNSLYGPATPVQLTYTVNPDSISVRFDSSGTQIYGAAIPTLTYTLSGVKSGDQVKLVTTSGVTAASPVGSYSASVALTGLSAANYTLSNPTLPVTVTPASLTVEAVDTYQLVGATPGSLNYALSGFQNGDTAAVVTGTPTLSTTATSSSSAGSYPITVGAGTLAASNYIFTNLANGEVNIFAPINLGAVSASNHVTQAVTFAAGLDPAASTLVLTHGATGSTFGNGSLACTAGSPGSCTVNVSFAPATTGLFTGALQLFDAATPANLLVSVPVYGTGIGPQVAFSGGAQSVFVNNVDAVNSFATDGLGNTYLATWDNLGHTGVFKLPAGGTLTALGSGWQQPNSIAVDGAGDVYVADSGLNQVVKFTAAGVQTTVPISQAISVSALALDAVGNLYVTGGGGTVYQITPTGSQSIYYEASAADNYPLVSNIAFSPTGVMYFANGSNGTIETAAQGGPATVYSSAIPGVQAIAFDSAGDIYAASIAQGAMGLYELTPSGAVTQLIAEGNSAIPEWVALDPAGNVYVANSYLEQPYGPGQIVKLDRVDAPSLNLSGTPTQSVSLSNIGNQALSFPVPASGTNPTASANFSYNSGAAAACPLVGSTATSAATLAAGASCALSVSFTPNTTTLETGSLIVTDTALNAGGAGGTTQTIALSGIAAPATMTSPVAGGTFAGPSATFSWTAAPGATSYYLLIGTTGAGSANVYNSAPKTVTSYTFTNLPTNGQPVYVRLTTNINGTWIHNDYVYTAAAQAAMISPASGASFTGTSAAFSWTAAANATGYYLWIGSTGAGSNNLYNSALKTVTTYTYTAMPTNGETIYVRLITNYNGAWTHADYTYTAATQALLTSPVAGSMFTGTSVTFTWSAAPNATNYYLQIGTTGVGSNNLYSSAPKTVTTYTYNGFPTNGETIYVRLTTNYSGTWLNKDYTFKAEAIAATITAPVAGSTFTGTSATFTWSAPTGVTGYYLWIGTTGVGSSNLYNSAQKTVNTYTFTGLPTNGATIYVRLITNYNGTWATRDYTYTAEAQAVMTSPAAGSVLPGASVPFTWTAASGATGYYLQIGSTGVGSDNIYNSALKTVTTYTYPTMPTNGETIYVRLITNYNGTWVHNDYQYTAAP